MGRLATGRRGGRRGAHIAQPGPFFDDNPQAMWIVDPKTAAILAVNEAALRLYGSAREEFLRKRLPELRVSEDVRDERPDRSRHLWQCRRADGSEFELEVWSQPTRLGRRDVRVCSASDVTESRRAARRLLERERVLDAARKLARLGSWEFDPKGDRVVWSDEMYRIFGLEPGDPRGATRDAVRYVAEEDRERLRGLIRRAVEDREPFYCEYHTDGADGSRRVLHARGEVVVDENGRTVKVIGTAQDITDRKSIEQSLQQQRDLYEALLMAQGRTAQGFGVVDLETQQFLYVNDPLCEIVGYRASELLSMSSFFEVLTPEAIAMAHERLPSWLSSGPDNQFSDYSEAVIFHRSGRRIDIEAAGASLRLEGRVCLIILVRDITRRKRDEAALRESESKFRRLLEAAPDAMVIADSAGRIVLANQQTERIFGYSVGELVGQEIEILVPEPHRSRHVGHRLGYFSDPRSRPMGASLSLEGLRKDGTRFPVEVSLSPMESPDGTLVMSAIRDITERKRGEIALRESEQRFRQVFHASLDPISLSSLRGAYIEINQEFLRITGFSREEVIGRAPADLGFWVDPEQEQKAIRALRESRVIRNHLGEFRMKDGTIRSALISAEVLRIGGEDCILSVMRDITERRRIEESLRESEAQLRQSQKMEAVGRLAAGVAHEINNPLTYVLIHLGALSEEVRRLATEGASAEQIEAMRSRLGEVQEGTDRVRRIVRDLKTFARRDEERRAVVDVNEVLDRALHMSANEIRFRARLAHDFGAVPRVVANEGRLLQIFLNLLINAAQAIEEGHADRNEVAVRTWSEDDHVLVEVRDTGRGIQAEHLEKIFDPFFTTKSVGEGSGLGLSICRNIAASLGGRIEVESEPGAGSRFRVRLPAALPDSSDVAVARVREADDAPRPRRRARVLVVDDEPNVRSVTAAVLSAEHDVVEAASGREALSAIVDQGEPFDLILCDLLMGDLSGMELYAALLDRRAPLARRIVFMTGGAFTPKSNGFLDQVPNLRIEKPFLAGELLGVVQKALSSVA